MKKPSFGLTLYVFWTLVTLAWWALAFMPMSSATPEWLVRTRDVCFGTLPNGLPDTYGWMTLVLSPVSMLGGIVVLWGEVIRDDLKRLRSSRAGWVFLILLFGLPVSGLSYVGHRTGKELRLLARLKDLPADDRLPSDYPRLDRQAKDFKLVDQHGKEISLADLSGRPAVVTFAYAHCTTVCPLVITRLNKVLDEMPTADIAGLVVTLDPYRDTPGSLPTLAENWQLNKRARILSGKPEDVNKMLKDYDIATERDEKTGEIAHLAIFYVLDGKGKIAYAFNNPSTAWLKEAVVRVSDQYAAR